MPLTPSPDASQAMEAAREVKILYVNYRGEKGWRRIQPLNIWFGSTEWHPRKQWLMDAIDLEKEAARSFALKDIQVWEEAEA
jgi:predicted DNA-binding transcriptional regulator YafY